MSNILYIIYTLLSCNSEAVTRDLMIWLLATGHRPVNKFISRSYGTWWMFHSRSGLGSSHIMALPFFKP